MKRNIFLGLLIILFFGCATARKGTSLTNLEVLQERLYSIEKKQAELEERQDELERELMAKQTVFSSESSSLSVSLTNKQIQQALKKAGFYKGSIDGKIGPQTKKAIIEFQKANNLKADGIVGKETIKKLREYLY